MRLYNNLSNKNNKDYKAMTKVTLFAFLCEAPNFIITLVSALISASPVVWVDTINCLGDTLHCFIVLLVSKMLQKNNDEKYNFGVERIEVLSSFVCDALVVIGMLAVLIGSIYGIIHPSQPADNLFLFLLLKVYSCIWDIGVIFAAIKAAKKANSKLGNGEVRNYIKALAFDLIVTLIVSITLIFKNTDWICYANPISSIILILIFIVIYIKKIKESIGELTDKSIPIENQDQIFDIILNNNEVIKKIQEINCRKVGDKTYIEICVEMKEDVTYLEQINYLDRIKTKINEIIPNSFVKLVIGQYQK